MQRIATGYVDAQHPKAIDADLYRRYSETLRKAVELVGVDETLQDRWMANVSRFAAYKAADATRRIAEAVMENGALDDGLNPLHAHRRYLAAEANTARTRARTGKQWQQFNDADRRRLFPNLRWVPSRSAMPREAHQLFWDKVWAKDDPFWQRNQPGTLWNCKCDWEETDDPVSTDEEKKLPNGRSVDDYTIKVRGLDGNPAETGQIFSDDASYVRDCEYGELVEHIYQGISEYDRLTASGDYKEMQFDWSSGAYKGVHKRHIDHSDPKEERYFNDQVSSTQLEKECMDEAYRMGHRSLLLEEGIKGADGNAICCLDLRLDGRIMDIRTITENNDHTILNGIRNKYRYQLKKYNEIHDEKCDTICLYFREPSWYSAKKVKSAIDEFLQYYRDNGGQPQLRHIVCIVKGETDIVEFDVIP